MTQKLPYHRFRNRLNLSNTSNCRVQYDWYTADGYGSQYPPYWRTTINNPVSGLVGVSGEISTMTDLVTPRFHALRKAGVVMFSPYKRVTCRISPGSGSSESHTQGTALTGTPPFYQQFKERVTGVTGGRMASGFSFPGSGQIELPFPNLTAGNGVGRDLIAEACTAAAAKRGQPDSNLWETLGELDKSAKMLPDMLRNTLKILDARGIGGAAAGLYLATRYGLVPLLKDINSVVQGMQKKLGATRISSRASAKDRYETMSTLTGPYDLGYGANVNLTTSVYTIEEVEVRAMSLDEVDLDRAAMIGLSPKGLMGLPWEFLTLSFVYDWFLNIGDFLYALLPALGWSNLGSCYTVRGTQRKISSIVACSPVSGRTLISAPSGSCERVHEYKTRVVGLRAPVIVVKADFRFDNITRALDAISLLTQYLGRALNRN